MKALIIGGGGREHALAWKAAQSPLADHVYVAPGNAGTSAEPGVSNVDIAANNCSELIEFAKRNKIGLTVVGPESPLAAGIVDRFREAGLLCYGPTAQAAQVEASKRFTKSLLERHGIPTASYRAFDDVSEAHKFIDETGKPLVIKADGLAAGKGVIIANTAEEAKRSAHDMLVKKRFGDAGDLIVVEEFLEGEEASFICMVDGETVVQMAMSQDHKAAYDNDAGPNTGGMGAYTPPPFATDEMRERIMETIINPTVRGLLEDGIHYTGFLYAGVIIDAEGQPKVLEFNCRFGDPETQPIMMRLKSDLVELCSAGALGELDTVQARWDERASLGVVAAAGGYPGEIVPGAVIEGCDGLDAEDLKVFHAGTAFDEQGRLIVSGGRVLCVTALADDIATAQARAYEGLSQIEFQDMHYRTDIGYRALA